MADTADGAVRARALARSAVALQSEGRLTEALETVDDASAAFGAEDDRQGVVLCERLAARLLLALGEADAARSRLEAAIGMLRNHDADPESAEIASCCEQLAGVLRQAGETDLALEWLGQARDGFAKADRRIRVATCDNDIGVLLARRGDHEQALAHLVRARAGFLASGRPDRAASAAFNAGTYLLDLGRPAEAAACLESARGGFIGQADTLLLAFCDQNLGVARFLAGRVAEAEAPLREARDAFAANGWKASQAACDHDLAVVLARLGRDNESDERQWAAASGGMSLPRTE